MLFLNFTIFLSATLIKLKQRFLIDVTAAVKI